mgnify:CR=1 FL=1
MIEAKAVSTKFWILKNENVKIGEMIADRRGYVININGNRTSFDSLEKLKVKTGIKFTSTIKKSTTGGKSIYGFPYHGDKFNEVWNIDKQLPLFTKKDDSKSWFVAGYFSVKIKGKWRTILSPKLLILERNEYKGPFKTVPYGDEITTKPTQHAPNSKSLSFNEQSPLSKWFK